MRNACILLVVLALRCAPAGNDSAPCSKGALGFETQAKRGGGIEIAEVLPGGPAALAGLREGDVLVQAGEKRIEFACEGDAAAFGRDCAPVRVVVERDGATIEVTITPADQNASYEKACAEGHENACFRLAVFEENPDEKLRRFEDACARGSGEACAAQGYLLMNAKSPDAVEILEKGCNRGSGAACAHLAYLYAGAMLVPRDEIRAMELYTRACNLGDARGCYSMGVFHDVGRGTTSNHARAAMAYEEACAAGVSMACTDAGFLYERGKGVAANQSAAVDFYRRGCEGSPCEPPNLRGCVNLGDAYRDGIGVPQDGKRAAEIFRTTCATPPDPEGSGERPRVRACVLLASMQFVGRWVEADEGAALRGSEDGCNRGDSFGCFTVAAIHARRGNYVLASAFFDRSCEAGDAEACYQLGWLHDNAQGVPFDHDRAQTLFRRACAGGFEKACEP